MINVDKLAKSIDIELIIQRLSDIGFNVVAIVNEHIELIRERQPIEKAHLYYLQEKLLESTSFPKGRWSRETRKLIHLRYRSVYLDELCKKFNEYRSIFRADNKDAINVYESLFDQDADPNILIFSRIGFVEREKCEHLKKLLSKQLIKELDLFRYEINEITMQCSNISKESIIRLIKKVSGTYGVKTYIWNEGSVIASMEIQLDSEYSLFCDWKDITVLKKWGQLILGLRLDLSASLPTSTAIYKNFNNLLPGSDIYFKTNKEMSRIALAFILIANTFSIVRNKNNSGIIGDSLD